MRETLQHTIERKLQLARNSRKLADRMLDRSLGMYRRLHTPSQDLHIQLTISHVAQAAFLEEEAEEIASDSQDVVVQMFMLELQAQKICPIPRSVDS